MILEEQFPMLRNTAKSKKIRRHFVAMTTPLSLQPDHNKFSFLSNTTVVAIFPDLCLWRLSLCSNVGGIALEKLCRATSIYRG